MTSYRTYTWKANAQPPKNYHELRNAHHGVDEITQDAILTFVREHPEVENSSGQSQRYSKKLITGDNEGKPQTLSFWNWLRTECTAVTQCLQFKPNGTLVFLYTYDYYELMNNCREWMKWRELEWDRRYSHLGVLDHGWWSHGLRLIARLQWWTIAGTDNWTNPKFDPEKSRRVIKWIDKKYKGIKKKNKEIKKAVRHSEAITSEEPQDKPTKRVGIVFREPVVLGSTTSSFHAKPSVVHELVLHPKHALRPVEHMDSTKPNEVVTTSISEFMVLDHAESIMNDIDRHVTCGRTRKTGEPACWYRHSAYDGRSSVHQRQTSKFDCSVARRNRQVVWDYDSS
jgi:hypothetical protein